MGSWTAIATDFKLTSLPKEVEELFEIYFTPKGKIKDGTLYGISNSDIIKQFENMDRFSNRYLDVMDLAELNAMFHLVDPDFELYNYTHWDRKENRIEVRSSHKVGDFYLLVKFFSWLHHLGLIDDKDNPILCRTKYSDMPTENFIAIKDGQLRVGEWSPFTNDPKELGTDKVYLDIWRFGNADDLYPKCEWRDWEYVRIYEKQYHWIELNGKPVPYDTFNWSLNTGQEIHHLANTISEFAQIIHSFEGWYDGEADNFIEEFPYLGYYIRLLTEKGNPHA